MDLGSHKVPGPDGFNANIIQQNWNVFGPLVFSEVQNFFATGYMLNYIVISGAHS